MPYLNLSQVPVPKDLNSQRGQAEFLKSLYDLLCKWRMMLTTTDITGGKGYVTISDSAPTDDDGNDKDIWIEHEDM